MKCVVSGINIKILARAIQMLSKIGEEMFVQPQEDCLSFRTVNSSNSAFVDITFQENYFSYYAYEDLEESDSLKCKILIRSALAVFKGNLDKQVESCHIQLDPNSEQLTFVLKYRNSIIKTHLLPILDCETIKANYKKDGTANHLRIQPRVMNDVVQNFQQSLLEITLEVLQEKVLIRNYIDESSNVSNETRTQCNFSVGEFDEYNIESDTIITFCLKELRAILSLADILSQPIDIHFERPGRPVVFVCKSGSMESNLVLATLNPDTESASQSTTSTRQNPAPKKVTKRAPRGKGIKSLGKKSYTNSAHSRAMESADMESPGRISDVSDLPTQNNRRKSVTDVSKADPFTPRSSRESTSVLRLEAAEHPASSERTNLASSLMKRKSIDQDGDESSRDMDNDDLVQNSPPRPKSKKAKLIFQKCFQKTFDPNNLPGHSNVEVEDSSESSEND
ncbi:hypothetical protein TKK_0019652 [Trichogramma kaykai]|uniref:Cell cycle checkpoint control protein n=1 Tax=Trichogramma kaykai TaxID=54128 RepID=A0ABD2VS96_9HYME